MANVLFLTQVLPYPLDAGPKVRAYYMLRHLAEQHQVTLVSFVRPDDRPEALAHLRGICAAVHTVPMRRSAWRNVIAAAKGLLTGLPIVIARDEMPQMAALLRRLTRAVHFDVIHADQLSMSAWGLLAADAPFVSFALRPSRFASFALRALRVPSRLRAPNPPSRLRAPNPPSRLRAPSAPRLLLDEHNAIYLLAQRMADTESRPLRKIIMQREARAFRRYEAAMLRAYDAVLTVTEEDRCHLLALSAPDSSNSQSSILNLQSRITPIPICVDPTQVAVVPRASSGPPTVLHLGTMFWPPNVTGVIWFARAVWPQVRAHAPGARFVIVGKNPPADVLALTNDPSITVTGYVPDPTPYLAAADAFVVPLHAGGGMRVKILDAWLWGLPIVSTPIGAEGMALRDGENILLAADADAFAAATVRCLTDPALNAHLRTAGRAWVEAQYAWQAVYRRVDEVYQHLLVPSDAS
jgi:glycosyltransferase involved in cell wall biosynthesis